LTDETFTFPRLARAVCGKERLLHRRTRAKLARDTWISLFVIHHTEAMARDPMGRLRRESWFFSKQRRYLDLALQLWMTDHNHVRRRFHYAEESPAQKLGFVDRRMKCGEVLSGRQDGGRESIHPPAHSAENVEDWMRRRAGLQPAV